MSNPSISFTDPRSNGQDPHIPDAYAQLSARFDHTFTDPRGFDYLTGEQVVSRLNDVLGVFGWSFEVIAETINEAADEAICLGKLRIRDPQSGEWVIREQFGSQKINRRRDTGMPVELGFDKKGSATDSLKKCASLVGVGLYLWVKEEQPQAQNLHRSAPVGPRPLNPSGRSAEPVLACADCNAPLERQTFKDGTVWEPFQLANFGQRKFNRVLCFQHYRTANDALKAAQS